MLRSLIFAFLFCCPSNGYKIFMYAPKIFYSHLNFLGHIADTLVSAGHDVVFYMPSYDQQITSNGTLLARTIEKQIQVSLPQVRGEIFGNIWATGLEEGIETFKFITTLTQIEDEMCQVQTFDENLLRRLRAEHFDLGIHEANSLCAYGLYMKLGIEKYVATFPTNIVEKLAEPFGIDSNPSHVPGVYGVTTDKMDFWQRLENTIRNIIVNCLAETISVPLAVKRLNENFAPIYDHDSAFDIVAQAPFLLANMNQYIEFPRAVNRKIVYIGGIAVDEPKPLNQEFRQLMDAAKGGVVLISMGSIAQSSLLPSYIKHAFVSSFRAFPKVTFLWKYEDDDDVAQDLPNVIKKKWVPQNDLLAHRNMRAFLSHGGNNGLTEGIQAGVPIIVIPLFFDQRRSAKKIEKQHAAIIIEKENITTTSITWAIRTMLRDKRQSSRRAAEYVKGSRELARLQVVKHVEIAASIGKIPRLDLNGRTMPAIHYYFFDLSLVLILFVLILSV